MEDSFEYKIPEGYQQLFYKYNNHGKYGGLKRTRLHEEKKRQARKVRKKRNNHKKRNKK